MTSPSDLQPETHSRDLTRAQIERLISDAMRIAQRLTHPGNSLPSRGERLHLSDMLKKLAGVAKQASTNTLLPLKD